MKSNNDRSQKLFGKIIPEFLFIFMILYLSGFYTFAQDRVPLKDQITARLEEFTSTYPREKIYLHFDRPFYFSGETIRYKAYYLIASGKDTSSFSNIIYTDLLDQNGEVLIHHVLNIENGAARGDFILPESLPHGPYLVRAYTNWMRNFDQAYFFKKEIPVFDPQEEYGNALPDPSEDALIDLQFFPEGGCLVSGLESKVAFKALNRSGHGTHVKGDIADQYGNVINSFQSFHLGMGAFFLKPEKGKIYFAIIIMENGKRINYHLPDVAKEGLAMAVENSPGDDIKVYVHGNEAYLNNHTGELLLLVQAAGKTNFTAIGNLTGISPFTTTIPKTDLPAGIVQITIFNAAGKPECERLIFMKRHAALQVDIEPDKKTYNPREKVHLDIAVKDFKGHPVAGHFSLAVTDSGQVANLAKYGDNILTNLLLTSELRGNIEQPAYYFINEDPRSETALDYLMLTQGWRRYLWKEFLNNKWPAINYNFEKNAMVRKGQVKNPSNNTKEKLLRVSYLLLEGKKPYNIITTENTNFQITIDPAYGKEAVFFDVTDIKGQRSNYKIIITNDLPGNQAAGWQEILFTESMIKNYLKTRREKSQIESAYNYAAENNVFSNAYPEMNDPGLESNGYFGSADHTTRLDEYNPFPNMAEVFREIVTHVSLQYKKGGDKIRVYSDEFRKNFDHQPLFMVDGIPTFNKTFVLNMDPRDVESIEVINAIHEIRKFGFLGQNGVIGIFTKNGTVTADDIPANNIITFQGYYHAREFYSPEYDTSTETDKSKPDLRSLIYWNPVIITDPNGNASVSFYNSDNITTVEVKIEGISHDGTPGQAGYTYPVIPSE